MKMNLEEYIEWMYNKNNEFNCCECPENQDMEGEQHRHPCGQQIRGDKHGSKFNRN